MVTPGSIQHMGGNTLALARHLTDAQASDHLLAKPRDSSSSRAFYFSLFGTHFGLFSSSLSLSADGPWA
jgi:hypothetical protein